MKQLLIGNAAIARGLWEAGCRFVSSYPGTPSTEITEEAAKFKDLYCEWAPNEKVAVEGAIGASVAGARAFAAMKHVGLNVAADPLYTVSYTGVRGGLVLAVADDQGMYSSQNEQDSRHHAQSAKVPMLEPSDSQECLDYTKLAFELSEKFDTPVLLRTCTRVAHSQSVCRLHERQERELLPYEKDPKKYVMLPANAIPRHAFVEERMRAIAAWGETSGINRIEMGENVSVGYITAGACYEYLREAVPDASVLKLGMVNPLPVKLIGKFASKVDKLIVVEELDPVIEEHCRAHGIRVFGGKDLFGLLGELSQAKIAKGLGRPVPPAADFGEPVPGRPPVLCPGCPHRGLFYTLKKMGLTVLGDIGCYTLGALPPLAQMDTCFCMGASVSGLHGFTRVRPEMADRTVCVIGDSTFFHSGITGLVNIVYNKGVSTVVILDNHITAMTGHQENPASGRTLRGEISEGITVEQVCQGVGVKNIRVVDPYDMAELEKVLREELAKKEPSVVIARRPCVMLPAVKAARALAVDPAKCQSCKSCMKLGCPALSFDGKALIDPTLCVGCGLCLQMCKFGAIGKKEAD